MNFRPLYFLILCVTTLLVASDLSAQQQKKEASETKDAHATNDTQKSTEQNLAADKTAKPKLKATVKDASKEVLLDIEMTDIGGNKVNLKKYQGKVVLVVNVASKCGFTGQYRQLQALHKEFKEKGLEVVAFPCNQFGKQEPASNSEIEKFCKEKFGIEFDLFSKVHVKGKQQAEFFKRLTNCNLAPAGKGAIYWNFEKFLIGKDGKPIARFRSNVSPDDDKIVSKLKAALGIKDEVKDDSKKQPSKAKAEPAKEKPETLCTENKDAPKDKQDKKS